MEGGFDVALRIGVLPDSALIAQRIGISRMVIAAHPSYLAKAGRLKQPADLSNHAGLLYSLSPTGARWTLTKGARSETIRMTAVLRANSSLALHQALLQGLGIARIPRFIVGADLAQGKLVQVLEGWDLPEQGIHAVTTSRDYVPQKTRAFIDFFRERIGNPAYWERGKVSAREGRAAAMTRYAPPGVSLRSRRTSRRNPSSRHAHGVSRGWTGTTGRERAPGERA